MEYLHLGTGNLHKNTSPHYVLLFHSEYLYTMYTLGKVNVY